MKARVYLRVAKTKRRGQQPPFKVSATVKPSLEPLSTERTWLPTTAFALDLDVPDEMFQRAEEVLAEIEIDPADLKVAAKVTKP